MVRYRCPHCGGDGIPGWRRLCLGPAVPTKCRECGHRVGVPWWSIVVGIPFLVAYALALTYFRGDAIKNFWLGALGAIIMVWLWDSFVPLIKR